jgi:Trk-type K+ transport system membrane component
MQKLFKTLRLIFFGSVFRGFVSTYLIATLLTAVLLKLPFSIQSGQQLSWIDAIFVSASAISTTGLSPIVIKDVLTIPGQLILLLLIQFGGIGLMMGLAIVWMLLGSNIGFSRRNMLMVDQNQSSRSGIVRFIKKAVILIFSIEAIGIVIFSLMLYFQGYFGFVESFYQGFFTVISLFTNAGFDISPGGDSFFMYRNAYGILSLSMILMFLGAVGWWPLTDIYDYVRYRLKRNKEDLEKFRFKVFTKWFILLHFGFWLISFVLFALIEINGFLASPEGPTTIVGAMYDLLFMSLTTRNAGFSTVPVTSFSNAGQILMMFLMFVGASPNSAGGGIRTVTLMLVVLSVISYARGHQNVVLKKRAVTIKQSDVQKAFYVIFLAGMLVFLMIFLMALVEPFSLSQIAFEVASAFGTTGLSTGITSALSEFSKILLIITMFLGRVGLLALIFLFKPNTIKHSGISYPEVDVIVG